MHTFVDNVASLVIEHCLVDELTTVFNPTVVGEMEDHTLAKLAAESSETLTERTDLEERINILDQGLATCLQHSSEFPDGMILDFQARI
jgi:riboflavin biosynthesis pyrimidine reductase